VLQAKQLMITRVIAKIVGLENFDLTLVISTSAKNANRASIKMKISKLVANIVVLVNLLVPLARPIVIHVL
jgi:hypothetical protein